MRILLANTSTLPDRMGGGERALWHLARGLRERGHDVRIVVPWMNRNHPPASLIEGVSIHRYPDRFHSFATLYLPSLAAARGAIARELRQWRPDIVHTHQGISGVAAGLVGAPPLCYTFHGPWSEEFLSEVERREDMSPIMRATRPVWAPAKATLARRIERAALHRSARVIVLSSFNRDLLRRIHGVTGPHVVLIPGGVDLVQFRPGKDRAAARRELRLGEDGPLLFTVRRLVPRMGLEMLLEALPGVPGARLVIGGEGSLRARLEHTAARLGIGDRVTFTGYIPDDDLALYYQAADLTVLPSQALEGFGLITLESLACGTPVVATPEGGTTDILASLEPSWIATDRTADAFAACVRAALARARDDTSLRARCRAHAETYSWARMAERHEALYESLRDGRS